ncbi:MAG: hypothetical protein JNM79_17065 [Burkholderiales bacterium]|nr:hypothetical protein [Burkholderiales bacterium]
MKLLLLLVALPRSYQLALAAAFALVIALRLASLVGLASSFGLAMLAVFAVFQIAIIKGHIPFNYG